MVVMIVRLLLLVMFLLKVNSIKRNTNNIASIGSIGSSRSGSSVSTGRSISTGTSSTDSRTSSSGTDRSSSSSTDRSRSSSSMFHVRNKYQGRYDFSALKRVNPNLITIKNIHNNDDTIDYTNANSVIQLNKAILMSHYDGIRYWDIPDGYLVPPIPSRADYIHHIHDLISSSSSSSSSGSSSRGSSIRGIDIGCGASLIYSLVGTNEYGWSFVSTDIDVGAIASARRIVENNNINRFSLSS